MPVTPQPIQGKFYPTPDKLGCTDWERCPVTSLCANYSAHRQKCICCHYTGVTEDEATEDGDLWRSMHCLRTNDFHRRTAANLELTRLATVDLKKPQELNKVDNDPPMAGLLSECCTARGPIVRLSTGAA